MLMVVSTRLGCIPRGVSIGKWYSICHVDVPVREPLLVWAVSGEHQQPNWRELCPCERSHGLDVKFLSHLT